MTYRLKRPVEISVCHVGERWAGRCLVPPHWSAQIVGGGPRKLRHVAAQGRTRDAAIRTMIERLQAAGYTGTARVEGGWPGRPPWRYGAVPQFEI